MKFDHFQLRLNQIMSSRAPGWIHIKLLQAAGLFWFMCPNKQNATVLYISNFYRLSPFDQRAMWKFVRICYFLKWEAGAAELINRVSKKHISKGIFT